MNIRAIIVDDEPLARDGMKMLLSAYDDIEIIELCSNGREAIKSIYELKPDLVFLDIQMPKLSGFDVIKAVGTESMPQVIFVTAYDQFAIEAFDVNAFDYLLKPVEQNRLDESIERVREQRRSAEIQQYSEKLSCLLKQMQVDKNTSHSNDDNSDRIVIRAYGNVHFVKPKEIFYVESGGDYITLHTKTGSHLLRETMIAMEKKLKPKGFLRIHRSTIVNLEEIKQLVATDSGDYKVILSNSEELKLSRHYRDQLYEAMNAPLQNQ